MDSMKTALTERPKKRKTIRPGTSYRAARRNKMRENHDMRPRRTVGLDTQDASMKELLTEQLRITAGKAMIPPVKAGIQIGPGRSHVVASVHRRIAKLRVAHRARAKAKRFAGVFGFPS